MGHRRLIRDLSPVAALLALALVAAGVAGFVLLRERERVRAERQLAGEVASGHANLTLALEREVERLEGAAARAGTRPPGAVTLVRDGASFEVVGTDASLGAALSSRRVETALRAALDDGRSRLVTFDVPGEPSAVLALVTPKYGEADVVGAAARRTAFTEFLAQALDLDRLVQRAYGNRAVWAEMRAGDLVVRAAPGDGSLEAGALVPVSDRALAVSVTAPDPGIGLAEQLALVSGLGAGVGLLAWAKRRGRALRKGAERDRALERQRRLVGRMGPAVQASLSLSDIIPAAALPLVDEFGLVGVAVDLVDANGELQTVFSYGSLTRVDAAATDGDGDLELVVVPLSRGGRTMGRLRMRPGSRLDDGALATLATVGEMLTLAVANALALENEQAAVRRLHELDRLKTDFVGTVSHELRTPLTAIVGFGHLLESGWGSLDDEQAADFLERINRNAAALASLLNQVLDFSRLERGTLTIEPRVADVAELLGATIERMAPVTASHVTLVDSPEHVWSLVDPDAFERVVSNLLTNAVKYSPEGSVVQIELRSGGADVTLVVDDAGPGVPLAERQQVFERFYRGRAPAVTETRGAGIGLAVVKELVERMGGEVDIGTSPAGGARFRVRLVGAEPPSAVESVVEEEAAR